jgi:hypothetical protein
MIVGVKGGPTRQCDDSGGNPFLAATLSRPVPEDRRIAECREMAEILLATGNAVDIGGDVGSVSQGISVRAASPGRC